MPCFRVWFSRTFGALPPIIGRCLPSPQIALQVLRLRDDDELDAEWGAKAAQRRGKQSPKLLAGSRIASLQVNRRYLQAANKGTVVQNYGFTDKGHHINQGLGRANLTRPSKSLRSNGWGRLSLATAR